MIATVAPAAELVGVSTQRLARIDELMGRLVEHGEAAGLVTLVARRGRVVQHASYGVLDLESRRPMPLDALFRIASMTKPITAAAVMQLFEEGAFLLDDPIADYLPEFGATRVYGGHKLERPITIRHLLTHTSGLTYPVMPGVDTPSAVAELYEREQLMRADEPLADKIRRLATMPLVHQPGERWTYSMSIDVLGRLVEVVSGLDFDVYLQRRLFEPLGMLDTDFWVPPAKASRLAALYSWTAHGLEHQARSFVSDVLHRPPFLMGGGGLVSTATDYARFALMLAGGGQLDGVQVLAPKTVELMLASQMSREQIPFLPSDWGFRDGYGMALGGRTLIDVPGSGLPGSVGSYTWQGAFSTDFWVDPREELVGLVMLQRGPTWFRLGSLLRLLTYGALSSGADRNGRPRPD